MPVTCSPNATAPSPTAPSPTAPSPTALRPTALRPSASRRRPVAVTPRPHAVRMPPRPHSASSVLEPTTEPAPVATASPAGPCPAVYRRRRVVAAALVLAVAWVGVGLGSEVVGRVSGTDGGLPAAGASGEPVPYVVQPGDTWWDLAARVDPTADPRPIVDALVAANGGGVLEVGRRILLPG
jgi:nucleoid-associated protein YgaU